MWIDKLEIMQKRLKLVRVDTTDEEIFMHVLNNLQKEYEMLVSILEHKLNLPNAMLSLSRLCVELRTTYQHLNIVSKKENHDEAYVSYKPFKGRCHNCGKIGHKFQQCRLNKDNNKNQDSNHNNYRNQ